MATLTTITTGMEKGPEAIDANFKTLGQVGNLKCVPMSTVSTVLNGLTQVNDGPCSFEVVDPINRVAKISFEMSVTWPQDQQKTGGVPAYGTQDVFQFNSSLFTSVVPNTPLIGAHNFNGWGNCYLLTYIHDHTVGFTANNAQGLDTRGGAYVACSFLAYY